MKMEDSEFISDRNWRTKEFERSADGYRKRLRTQELRRQRPKRGRNQTNGRADGKGEDVRRMLGKHSKGTTATPSLPCWGKAAPRGSLPLCAPPSQQPSPLVSSKPLQSPAVSVTCSTARPARLQVVRGLHFKLFSTVKLTD